MKKVLMYLLIINLFSCESEMEKNIMTQEQMSDFLFEGKSPVAAGSSGNF